MKAVLVYVLALMRISTAISIGWRGGPQNSPIYEKPSPGTQLLNATTTKIRSQSQNPWASQAGIFGSEKRHVEILQSPKPISNDAKTWLNEPTTRLQPNFIIRQSKTLPELAAEALLKLGKVSEYKQTRSLVTLDIILPLSQSSFDRLKQWDHPIGRAVKAFDDAITSMQKQIGGEQVSEIFGNELKLKIICYLRGEQRYRNAVDNACERLHESNQQEALRRENEMRDKLVQIFKDCDDATKTDEQDDLLQICNELSRKTLDLEKATEELIALRGQLQQKVRDGGKIEQKDIDEAVRIIRQGGIGMPRGEDWAQEVAAWYLGSVIASPAPSKNEADCEVLPTWVTETVIQARDIPQNETAQSEASRIISSGFYRGLFTYRSELEGTEQCWSASGLMEDKPAEWDLRSAALIYVNTILQPSQIRCKACDFRLKWEWQLRCGSTKASPAV